MARDEPGKLNWASVTGANELLFDSFLKTEKLSMAKVSYKNPVDAANDLAEGRIHPTSAAYAIVRPRVEAGKVDGAGADQSQARAAIPQHSNRPRKRASRRSLSTGWSA